jgi:hypothetical protein
MRPAYRLTVYAPRSVNAGETTVLTPAATAPHADAFQIASVQGLAGFKPYFGELKGRKGAIDHLTKKLTTGALTLKCFDVRTTAGGDNLHRWATGFLGDATGKAQLIGCRIFIEECLDWSDVTLTGTWAPYFTGRIYDLGLDGPLWITLQVRDFADDLKRQLFTAAPHVSVAANIAYVNAISVSRGGYAGFPTLVPMGYFGVDMGVQLQTKGTTTATINAVASTRTDGLKRVISRGSITIAGDGPQYTMLCDLAHTLIVKGAPLRVTTTLASGQQIAFRYYPNFDADTADVQYIGGITHRRLAKLSVVETIPGDALYGAFPAPGTIVECAVSVDAAASKDCPLHLVDVHPVQLFADILDGKLSLPASGGPLVPLAGRDTSGADTGHWAALLADQGFRKARFVIDAPVTASTFLEQQLCQVFQLAYRFDALGNVVLIDLRRTANTVSAGTFVDDDLDTTATPGWSVSRDTAITAAEITYYIDRPKTFLSLLQQRDEYPIWPLSLQSPTQDSVLIPNDLSTLRDVGEKIQKIDAKGIRYFENEPPRAASVNDDPGLSLAVVSGSVTAGSDINKLFEGFFAPYATGAAKYTLHCRRTPVPSAAQVGQWYTLTVSKLPDPASNSRGANRLGLCLSRTENGNTIDLEFLDAGASSVAVAPVLGTAVLSSDPTSVDLPLTLNAAGETVAIEVAITPAGTATRPDERAASWLRLEAPATSSGTVRLGPYPKGTRVWFRARSTPIGTQLKLPSGWAVAGGTGYVDLPAVLAPTALAVPAGMLYANRADVTWTVGDATLAVELYLVTGGVPSAWAETMKLVALRPGSVMRRLWGLSALTQYTVGVLHRDANRGPSPMAVLTFTTTNTLGTAPRPAGVSVSLAPSV